MSKTVVRSTVFLAFVYVDKQGKFLQCKFDEIKWKYNLRKLTVIWNVWVLVSYWISCGPITGETQLLVPITLLWQWVLVLQTLSLMRHRLGDSIHIEEYTVGKCLLLSYWRFVSLLVHCCDFIVLHLFTVSCSNYISVMMNQNTSLLLIGIKSKSHLAELMWHRPSRSHVVQYDVWLLCLICHTRLTTMCIVCSKAKKTLFVHSYKAHSVPCKPHIDIDIDIDHAMPVY